MLQKPCEVDGPLVVGRAYLVECVWLVGRNNRNVWLPVLSDHVGDLSGKRHIHFDIRFLSESEWNGSRSQFSYELPKIIKKSWRRCLCYRPFISEVPSSIGFREAEVIFYRKGLRLRPDCRKCPHQGTDLGNVVPVTEHGRQVIVCPSHGLGFDAETGKMVLRRQENR